MSMCRRCARLLAHAPFPPFSLSPMCVCVCVVAGKSYLRMEDLVCYTAAALRAFGEAQRGTDATAPFDPRPLG